MGITGMQSGAARGRRRWIVNPVYAASKPGLGNIIIIIIIIIVTIMIINPAVFSFSSADDLKEKRYTEEKIKIFYMEITTNPIIQ